MTQKRAAMRKRRKRKYRFTRQDCQRGYRAALAKCMEDWDLYAWFWRRLRKHYSRKEAPREP